jgi:putative colanic acid biosynthesis acetyltransferase WcaF
MVGQPSQASSIDVAQNRKARKWSNAELAARLLWAVSQPLFRFSPRVAWGWRTNMLKLFGARVGRQVHIHPTVRVAIPWNLEVGDFAAIGDCVRIYNLGLVTIGSRACISQGAHLCGGTHDYRKREMPLVKCSIAIEEDAWICADAFVGPNVTVARAAIVGARAVVMRNVASNSIVSGNPAVVRRQRPRLI